MEMPDCSHERIEEHGELVCIDCGLVMGPIFRHDPGGGGGNVYFGSTPSSSLRSEEDRGRRGKTLSTSQEEALRDAVSNALARLFLDSDAAINEAVRTWKRLSLYRNTDTSCGRRQLAYTLWKTLADNGVLREKVDFERACGADVGSVARLEKKMTRDDNAAVVTHSFKPPSERVETLGSWLGLPFRYRKLVASYMRTFELDNRFLTQKPEILAAASLLYVCDRIRRRVQSDRKCSARRVKPELPEYMRNITPDLLAELINADRKELKVGYETLVKRRV